MAIGFVLDCSHSIAVMFFSYFNRLAVLSNRIDNSLSQIDVQLKRRVDLIPNLIETVKGYAKHEKSIMTEVTKAREAWFLRKILLGRVKANGVLQRALGRLFAIAENYPTLKANENFLSCRESCQPQKIELHMQGSFIMTASCL